MKTIFITSFHSLISRNILQVGILSGLVKNNIKVVLLAPENKIKYFQKIFNNENNITVEGISAPKKHFEDLINFLSLSLVGVENHVVWGWKTQGSFAKYYTANIINILFSRFFFFHKLLRFVSKTYLCTNTFESLFIKYKPNLIFTTDSFYREDRSLIVEAKKKGITTVGMIRSWDNATTKGVLLAEPDSIIVPNGVLKEELVSIHHISPKKITITGIPHYDKVSHKPSASKEEFFKEMGLSLKKNTILFAPGGKILYKHDKEILVLLKKYIDEKHFSYPVQFLIRIPPSDKVDTSSIINNKNFIIDEPGVNITGRRKASELTHDDNDRLNNSLFYSDIVLTLASTMIIDAAVFGKPTVVWAFDPLKEAVDPISKFGRYTHLKKLFKKNVCVLTENEGSFISAINNYLKHPEYDKDKRDKIVSDYCYKLDGNSGKRVLSRLLSALNSDSHNLD